MRNREKLTEPMRCAHCGNVAPMKKGASYSALETEFDKESGLTWDQGQIYEILECLSCKKISLTATFYADYLTNEEAPQISVLYPVDDKIPVGLTERIERAYEAALNVRSVDANAFGVLVGRVLEMVCDDRKAKGNNLSSRLADLASRGETPSNLVGVANGLRNLRNVGAHPLLGELTADEVPILSDLVIAILEYVYSAPYLAKAAQDRLEKLKKKRSSRKKD